MPKVISTLFLVLVSSVSLAAENVSYAGIWRDEANSSDYFAIHEKGDQVVLIALPGVEQSGDTLKFSYIGSRQDFIMSRLQGGESATDIYSKLKLEFLAPDRGRIYPLCDACGVRLVNLRKIF